MKVTIVFRMHETQGKKVIALHQMLQQRERVTVTASCRSILTSTCFSCARTDPRSSGLISLSLSPAAVAVATRTSSTTPAACRNNMSPSLAPTNSLSSRAPRGYSKNQTRPDYFHPKTLVEMWITCLDRVSANSEKGRGAEWAVSVGQRLQSRCGQSGAVREMNMVQIVVEASAIRGGLPNTEPTQVLILLNRFFNLGKNRNRSNRFFAIFLRFIAIYCDLLRFVAIYCDFFLGNQIRHREKTEEDCKNLLPSWFPF